MSGEQLQQCSYETHSENSFLSFIAVSIPLFRDAPSLFDVVSESQSD